MKDFMYMVTYDNKVPYEGFYKLHISYNMQWSLAAKSYQLDISIWLDQSFVNKSIC